MHRTDQIHKPGRLRCLVANGWRVARGTVWLLLGCVGGMVLILRCLPGSACAEELLPDRDLGDPLILDSHPDPSGPLSLRFKAATPGYYVMERRGGQDADWKPVALVTDGDGETLWRCPADSGESSAIFRLAEYPRTAPADCDRDGMHDLWETGHGLHPLDASDANGDPDEDQRTNLQESLDGTSPHNPDTNPATVTVLHPPPGSLTHWLP